MNAQVFVMALTSCYERSNSVRPARRPSSTQFGRANKQPHSLAPSSGGAIFPRSRRTSTQCSVCNNRLCSRLTKSLHRISELRLVSALSPRERAPNTAEHTGTIWRETGRRLPERPTFDWRLIRTGIPGCSVLLGLMSAEGRRSIPSPTNRYQASATESACTPACMGEHHG